MKTNRLALWALLACISLITPLLSSSLSQSNATTSRQPDTLRDGQHDFDFEIGKWITHLWRLQHPLSHSNSWVEYWGTTAVSKVWNGRANLVELDVKGPAGHIEALSLRLYNP